MSFSRRVLLGLGLACNACGLLLDWPLLEASRQDGSDETGVSGGGSCLDCPPSSDDAAPPGGDGGKAPSEPVGSGGKKGTAGESPVVVCEDECDCDGDGAMAPSCGGDDCDDDDPLVFPGQTAFFSVPAQHAHVGFDYDCSTKLERDPLQGGNSVLNCGLLGLANCEKVPQAFVELPACGQAGDWSGCAKVPPLNATCKPYVADAGMIARCH